MNNNEIIIIGAGGFSKSIIDAMDGKKFFIKGFIDTYKTGKFLDYEIISNSIENVKCFEKYKYFIGIGDPIIREFWFKKLKKYNLDLINVIDKTSIVSKRVKLGTGIFIGKMVIVNSDVTLEDNVVLNTRSLIEHGNYIGKHSNISTNSVLNGDVKIGNKTFIGSCTVVNGQIVIGNNSIVGSGSVVIKDIENNVVVAGSPTRLIRRVENE